MNTPLSRAAVTIAAMTAALLMVPLLAMQFTDEVNWGVGDFIAAGVLLSCAGMAYLVAARRARGRLQTFAVAIVVVLVFGIVWAELAVGLFH
jgi:hypothetical protein